jgi:hypothetical protein
MQGFSEDVISAQPCCHLGNLDFWSLVRRSCHFPHPAAFGCAGIGLVRAAMRRSPDVTVSVPADRQPWEAAIMDSYRLEATCPGWRRSICSSKPMVPRMAKASPC